MNRLFLTAAAGALALSAAACTTGQEQQVIDTINAACIALPIGSAIAVEIASSLAGGAGAVTIANVVQADGTAVCQSLVSGVGGVVSQINAAGGTATVKVSTGGGPSGRKMARYGTMVFRPGVAVYVVPPI